MASTPSSEATQLLERISNGDALAAETLAPLVYEELRRLARAYLRRESPQHTLQTTALVHEAYVRLIEDGQIAWSGRAHFLAIAARVMRRVLVEHARRSKAAKRGGPLKPVTLREDLGIVPPAVGMVDTLALDQALNRLAERHERQAQVVVLRFFGGLSIEQVAHALGVSDTTVENDWFVARAFMRKELG